MFLLLSWNTVVSSVRCSNSCTSTGDVGSCYKMFLALDFKLLNVTKWRNTRNFAIFS